MTVVKRVRKTVHQAPDTIACIFWLKNRSPERWGEAQAGDNQDALQELVKAMKGAASADLQPASG
jgi:hypothetical protein